VNGYNGVNSGNGMDGSLYSSSRKESDTVEILSGVFEGNTQGELPVTLGTPVGFIIRNENACSEDYSELQHLFRPAHADDTYFHKYGVRDWRGGGRASARETAVRVVVGAFAKMLLRQCGRRDSANDGITIGASVDAGVGRDTTASSNDGITVEAKIIEMGDAAEARAQGDSVGGIIECIAKNVPRSLGEPLYDKLSARLAYAMMSIPASRSFEIGKGIEATKMCGSRHNDIWHANGTTENNYAGGIRGGISTGENIILRVGFKPIPSIAQKQQLLSDKGELVEHSIKGRHDITCVFRALPIVEAMTAITLADFILMSKTCSGT
jgi:chorismate synthase